MIFCPAILIFLCVHTRIYVGVCLCVHICIHVGVCLCVHIYVYMWVRVCVCAYVYMWMPISLCVCMGVCSCVCTFEGQRSVSRITPLVCWSMVSQWSGAHLCGQTPGIHPSLPPQCCDYKLGSPHPAFLHESGNQSQVLRLAQAVHWLNYLCRSF